MGVCGKCVQQIIEGKGGQKKYDYRIMHHNHTMTIPPKQKQAEYAIITIIARHAVVCVLNFVHFMSNTFNWLIIYGYFLQIFAQNDAVNIKLWSVVIISELGKNKRTM